MATKKEPSLAQIAQTILEDTLHNIIHDTILAEHHAHKILLLSLDPATKLPHCDRCKLPRLLDPPLASKVRGAASEPPKDTAYCEIRPWSRRPGHDIYDNPFPKADVTGRPPTKKEREAAAKNGKKDDGTPASEEPTANGNDGTAPPSPTNNDNSKLEKGEKKANKIDEKLKKGEYVPWHTCPSCKRSLLITRFAKHLEQCMGLSGRQAARSANAKISGTPAGSRGGTPNPGSQEAGDGEDDEETKGDGGVRKKLLKKKMDKKLLKKDGAGAARPAKTGKPQHRPAGGGGASGATTASKASPAPSSASKDTKAEKRDHDEMLLGFDAVTSVGSA